MADTSPTSPTSSAANTLDGPSDRPTPLYSPVCSYCAHWSATPAAWQFCAAYPAGGGKRIPQAIWGGRVLHVQPYPGDHDIQFQPAAGVKRTPANAKLLDAYANAHDTHDTHK